MGEGVRGGIWRGGRLRGGRLMGVRIMWVLWGLFKRRIKNLKEIIYEIYRISMSYIK